MRFTRPLTLNIPLEPISRKILSSREVVRSRYLASLYICHILLNVRDKNQLYGILSLVGLLQHAMKVLRSGRIFVPQMYSTAAKLRELTFLLD